MNVDYKPVFMDANLKESVTTCSYGINRQERERSRPNSTPYYTYGNLLWSTVYVREIGTVQTSRSHGVIYSFTYYCITENSDFYMVYEPNY